MNLTMSVYKLHDYQMNRKVTDNYYRQNMLQALINRSSADVPKSKQH